MAKSSNSNVFNVVLPVLSKKIIAIQLLSLVCLIDELVWLPLFERRKHSRLTVFHKALNNLSAFSLDHLSVSSRHTIYSRASNENKFVSLPFSYRISLQIFIFSSDHYWLEFPPIGWSSLAVDSVLPRGSAKLDILQPLEDDTPAVMGGLHLLLDIAPKNRRHCIKGYLTWQFWLDLTLHW